MRHDLPEVYDDRPLRGPRPPRTWPLVFSAIALIALGVAAWFFLQPRPAPPPRVDTGPVRVVRDRPGVTHKLPGAAINQAEAIRLLQRHLGQTVSSECLVVMGKGSVGSAYLFTAFNRCDNTRLGQWKVDGKTRAVSRK